MALLAGAAGLAATVGVAPQAQADADLTGNVTTQETLSWSLAATTPTTLYTGDTLVYQFGLQCSAAVGNCTSVDVTLTAPAGASGPGVFQGTPPADLSISNNGKDIVIHYDGSQGVQAGTARYFTVAWPTVNGTTAPGDQTVTMTVQTAGEQTPWPTKPTATMKLLADSTISLTKQAQLLGGTYLDTITTAYYDQPFTYSIAVSAVGIDPANSGHGFLQVNGTITDPLPDGMEFLQCVNTTGCSYDVATRTVCVPMNLVANSHGIVQTVGLVVRFPSQATTSGSWSDSYGGGGPTDGSGGKVAEPGTGIDNTATYDGTQAATDEPRSASDTWTVTLSDSTPDPSQGGAAKVPQDDAVGWRGETWSWGLDAINTTPAGTTTMVMHDDQLNTELFDLVRIGWGAAGAPSAGSAVFTYEDSTTSTPTSFTAGQLSLDVPNHSDTNRVTGVVLTYDAVPSGSSLHTQLVAVLNPRAGDGPWQMDNCMSVVTSNDAGTTQPAQACGSMTILPNPPPRGSISKDSQTLAYYPGDTFTWHVGFSNTFDNGSTLVPNVWDVMPNGLTYVPGSLQLDTQASNPSAGCPTAEQFTESIDDAWLPAGSTSGTTYVKVNWKADADVAVSYATPLAGSPETCMYTFSATVKPGSPDGTYSGGDAATPDGFAGNRIYLRDQVVDYPTQGSLWLPLDTLDVDGDGRTTDEAMWTAAGTYQVASKAQVMNTKEVSGDQDVTASGERTWYGSAEITGQSDQVGTSTPGGTVSYRLTLGNYGNQPVTDLVAYDLLPFPGNPGVSAVRYGDAPQGGNTWVPAMTGPIDTSTVSGQAASTLSITYSTKTDPCRPEMNNSETTVPAIWCNGQQDDSWMSATEVGASPGGWAAIRSIRIDFGSHTFVGGEMYSLTFTMDTPTVLASGAPIAGGEPTWNKLAVQANQRDGSGNVTSSLLAAEYPWVVDIMKVTTPTPTPTPTPTQPAPSPSTLPNTGPTPSPGEQPTTPAPSATTPATPLPLTGTEAGMIGLLAVLLIAVGAGAMLRRRRAVAGVPARGRHAG